MAENALHKIGLKSFHTPSAETRPLASVGRVDLADYPSFFEFRFPLAPIKHGNRNGNSLKKLAQTTIKKRAHAHLASSSSDPSCGSSTV